VASYALLPSKCYSTGYAEAATRTGYYQFETDQEATNQENHKANACTPIVQRRANKNQLVNPHKQATAQEKQNSFTVSSGSDLYNNLYIC
jgi:hypothetical protein